MIPIRQEYQGSVLWSCLADVEQAQVAKMPSTLYELAMKRTVLKMWADLDFKNIAHALTNRPDDTFLTTIGNLREGCKAKVQDIELPPLGTL